jgi:dTDP-4-amino-4,6-dideoxygalactose transaminase
VIEDAAQALGARWRGQAVGMAGTLGFYSLAAGKGLTTFEGGVLVARDAAMRHALQMAATTVTPVDWRWELRRSLELLGYALLYRPPLLTLAYGLPLRRALRQGRLIEAVGDDFSDAIPLHTLGAWRRGVGAHALQRLPPFLATLQAQATQRLARLARIDGLRVMRDAEEGSGTWPFFMLLLPDQQRRDAALAQLWQRGLGVSRLFIHALGDYPYLAGRLSGTATPHARDFAARMLTLSNSPWLGDEDFERVCATLERVIH